MPPTRTRNSRRSHRPGSPLPQPGTGFTLGLIDAHGGRRYTVLAPGTKAGAAAKAAEAVKAAIGDPTRDVRVVFARPAGTGTAAPTVGARFDAGYDGPVRIIDEADL